MVFTSCTFIIFLAATLLVYYLTPLHLPQDRSGRRVSFVRPPDALPSRSIVLLLASLVFYAFAGWEKLLYVLGTALLAWLFSRRIAGVNEHLAGRLASVQNDKAEERRLKALYRRRARRWLVFGIFAVLLIYAHCKYLPQLADALNGLLTRMDLTPVRTWDIVVPLGLSYYTLSIVGYLLDVFWNKQKHERNFPLFLLCVLYFPQILQGPISRYREMREEYLRETHFSAERIARGAQLMLWGFFKKLVIADRLNIFVTGVLDNSPAYQGVVIWVTALASTFQLYADFSGCMDIAAGVSELFGIQIAKNFDHPFAARSVAEWWRRWHITLCAWMKDYVYLPLAVSPRLSRRSMRIRKRRGPKAARAYVTVITLGVVWLLTGLWHDISWCYLAWGCYYALFLIVDTVLQPKRLTAKLGIDGESPAWRRFQMVRTTLIFSMGRLLTVPGDLRVTLDLVRSMFTRFNPWALWDGTLCTAGLDLPNVSLSLCLVLLLLAVERAQIQNGPIRDRLARTWLPLRWLVWYAALAGILIFGIYGAGYSASSFAYMNF